MARPKRSEATKLALALEELHTQIGPNQGVVRGQQIKNATRVFLLEKGFLREILSRGGDLPRFVGLVIPGRRPPVSQLNILAARTRSGSGSRDCYAADLPLQQIHGFRFHLCTSNHMTYMELGNKR